MKKIHSFLLAAVLGAALVISVTQPVHAQQSSTSVPGQGNGLRIAPVRFEHTIEKGGSQSVLVYVENVTGSAMQVRGIVNDFVSSDNEGGEPRIILDENKSAPGNSFKLLVGDVPSLRILPGERKEVRINLSVPSDAASGGYYGAVRWTPDNSQTGDEQVALAASVGSIFLVKVPGQITEKLSVESFRISRGSGDTGTIFNSGPLKVETRFRNFGNIHVQPFGKILIKNGSGKTIQEIEINKSDPRGSVLPTSIRKFENDIKEKRLFGKYTAEGNFGYGSNGELISAKKTFYVIPYMLVLGILFGVLFVIFILPRLVRRYIRSQAGKARR